MSPNAQHSPPAELPRALPMSRAEMAARGWDELDVLLVTGDAYVDHPAFGAAVIGRVLEAAGWRVGIVAQPDWRTAEALTVMGVPRLCVGVTAGNLDSLLANYTAARRRRREDAYSPGGQPGRRPNYATVVYAQLARQAFPGVPVILGGVEASLRRVAHYDYWQDRVRPSLLADAKAELLVYGMGERAVLEAVARLAAGTRDLRGIRGTAWLAGAREARTGDFGEHQRLPSYEACVNDPQALLALTHQVEDEQNPFCGQRLVQFHGDRAVVVEPPGLPLEPAALDQFYALPFSRRPHPSYTESIPAFAMIEHSITVLRGCPGGCSFCGLGLHQGKFLTSRSQASAVAEIQHLTNQPGFHGTISDLGGPTANLYGCRNGVGEACHTCRRPSCLYPTVCPRFELGEEAALALLAAAAAVPRVKHVFIASGIRMDVALRTPRYLERLVRQHVSGHLKVAPEHLAPAVLRRMRKHGPAVFAEFRAAFERWSRAAGKQQYLVPYFISNFPGCTDADMQIVSDLLCREHWQPQQVQDYIPLPMTPAAAMYYSGRDYETGEPITVRRGLAARRPQRNQLRPPGAGGGPGRPG